MKINNFKEMYLAELSELHSVEKQLVEALATMEQNARHGELKKALAAHREQTQSQRDRVARLLQGHGVDPDMHQDQSMLMLIREANKMAGLLTDPDLTDAGLIASAQRIEHYEIAGYGTLATYAEMMGLDDDKRTLGEILDEEKAADTRLTALAESVINRDALHRGQASAAR